MQPPRFALLVGGASADARNFLGLGELDFVPTKLVDTVFLETASDDWFVDADGDGLPAIAVGRLPVRTAALVAPEGLQLREATWSSGTPVAAALALLSALVLIATGAKLRVAPQLLELARRNFPAAVELVSEWEWGSTAPVEIKELGKLQLLAGSPAVTLYDYRACDAFDVREQLKSITAPTLIVAGDADQMTPLKHAV